MPRVQSELRGFLVVRHLRVAVKGRDETRIGDAYTFIAIERHSKLVLTWHLGQRTERDTVPRKEISK